MQAQVDADNWISVDDRWETWQAAIPKGFVLMPEKLSIEQVNGLYYSGHAWGTIDETKEYFEDVYDTLISSRGI